jgi:valyl-tRNA synthetase
METGDIIFLGSSQILSTTFMTGQVPFKTVICTAWCAPKMKKMSKSPESIIDPLTVIPEYGTDAHGTYLEYCPGGSIVEYSKTNHP